MRWTFSFSPALVAALLFTAACQRMLQDEALDSTEGPAASRATAIVPSGEPLEPLRPPPRLLPGKVTLGRRLFHDPLLSGDGSLSCAMCHALDHGGADGRPLSMGIGQRPGQVNTPTVLNSSLNFFQFWDGRAATLESQIDGPLLSAVEMGSSWDIVVGRLRGDAGYRAAFSALYPDAVTAANVRDAIATFERTLITVNSRFDLFLAGHKEALSAEEQQGYALFKSYGCVTCHQGAGIGGNMFQRLGVAADYFKDRGHESRADQGRFNVTGRPADRHMFKVPSLRNVALTAPYLHDGEAETLSDAVAIMARYQLGRRLSPAQSRLIVLFLNTLTGELPAGEKLSL